MARYYYKKGAFNRIDDRSGFKKKSTDTKQEWTGMIVATESWEPRNAQDFVRGIPDEMWVENARPDSDPNYSLAPLAPPTAYLIYNINQTIGPIVAYGFNIIFIPSFTADNPSEG